MFAHTNTHTNFPHPDQFINTNQLVEITGMTRRFWENRRMIGDTPPFVSLSPRAVVYRWKDVEEWLKKRIDKNTSNQGTK